MNPRAGLSVHNVSYSYPKAKNPTVSAWTQEFYRGAVTAITGASGCGKSTRLYLLSLMLKANNGATFLGDQRVDNLSGVQQAALRAKSFGFVFQDSALDPTRTVIDNICETALYRRDDVTDYSLRARQLLDEFKVDVPADRRPGQISGGQAQRIALCRALVGQPQIILADEPTGNLDPKSSEIVLSSLEAAADDGATVIMVTHDPQVAQRADFHLHIAQPRQASS